MLEKWGASTPLWHLKTGESFPASIGGFNGLFVSLGLQFLHLFSLSLPLWAFVSLGLVSGLQLSPFWWNS
jgi:hypothetical protein